MLNSFLGIGRIGQDAVVRDTKSGAMATFSIALDRISGRNQQPDWIPCSLFGERAQVLAPYLTRGTLVGISGRLEVWKDQDGVPRFGVNVREVNFLSRKSSEQEESATAATADRAGEAAPANVPF
jgi:single-strand DNA-binding protein